MTNRQTRPEPGGRTIPDLWLLSDARNDTALERAIAALSQGSGFVYRHYHLGEAARRARFDALVPLLRAGGHRVVLSGTAEQASAWAADGVYGPPERLADRPAGLLAIATAHDEAEIAAANRTLADAVMLSPVFPTRSHPGGKALGARRFHALAANAAMPVIALGGMTAARAAELDWPRWAAVDGLA